MRRKKRSSQRLMVTAILVVALCLPIQHGSAPTVFSSESASQEIDPSPARWTADPGPAPFVYYSDGGQLVCRPATEDEALSLEQRDPSVSLGVLSRPGLNLLRPQDGELTIILRGTPQLDNFPQAKEAFMRAAAKWQAGVQADITIVIDVDFGPTRFGQPFPPGVVGSANAQQLSKADAYREVRTALIAGAASADKLALYNALPENSVPTNLGNTNQLFTPSALLRALGLIARVADPAAEQADFGSPPSVVFNSNAGVTFDFDPRDGITPNQLDFEAIAVHEIGHVLGFTSLSGFTELNPNNDLLIANLDLFRFRPGAAAAGAVVPANFTTAQRILSSGGEQVFFAGGAEVALSTGRPDGSGGDGFQAGHWKDDRFAGRIIGIMDPVITVGDTGVITENDLRAFDAIGYGANLADAGAPTISKVSFKNGNKLVIKGKDLSGNLQLEVNFEMLPVQVKPKPNTKKAIVKASAAELNLNQGANQVRLIRNGLRSNVFVVNL